MTKKTRYFLEGFSLWLLFVLFASLSPRTASAIGGFLGRTFGPLLAASRKARRNLASVFPDMSSAEQSRIIAGMWCNLGRVIAEYPHLKQIAQYRTEVVGGQHVLALIERAQPAVFIGGHLATSVSVPRPVKERLFLPVVSCDESVLKAVCWFLMFSICRRACPSVDTPVIPVFLYRLEHIQ